MSQITVEGKAKNFPQTCSFCQVSYMAIKADADAKYHTCAKEECQREYERVSRRDRRDAVGDNWQDRINRFEPGEEIATLRAKVTGGRFTANGGAQVTLVVAPSQKQMLVDVTDYSQMMVEVTFRRLERKEELDRGATL